MPQNSASQLGLFSLLSVISSKNEKQNVTPVILQLSTCRIVDTKKFHLRNPACSKIKVEDLCSNRLFDERLCFRAIVSIIFFFLIFLLFKLLAFLRDSTDRFETDLVGNQDCWFSQAKANKSISLYFEVNYVSCPSIIKISRVFSVFQLGAESISYQDSITRALLLAD